MRNIIKGFLGLLFLTSVANATQLGAEAGVLYLKQNGGGETTTVLPMGNIKLYNHNEFSVNVQLGGTAYRDSNTDKTFWIGVARVNPVYHFTDTKFSIEGLLGLQQWEGKGVKADLGARLNYQVRELAQEYVDNAFVGGGSVQHDQQTNYFTVGIEKWF